MSTRTTNYNFIIGEGSDVVNPLTQIFPNFTSLDDILRDIADSGITTATELVTGTVHALTRADARVSVFRFQATSNFTSGETFTVDGAQVTALDVAGETLRTGAYIVGSMVLCELRDTLLTVYVSGATDAETLEGHPANYFATAADLATVDGKADANRVLIDNVASALSRKILLLNKNVAIDNIAPNTSQLGSITFDAPAGYSLSGIVCYNTSNEWVIPIGFTYNQTGQSCVLNCTGKNFASSSTRADITITCLFVLN